MNSYGIDYFSFLNRSISEKQSNYVYINGVSCNKMDRADVYIQKRISNFVIFALFIRTLKNFLLMLCANTQFCRNRQRILQRINVKPYKINL